VAPIAFRTRLTRRAAKAGLSLSATLVDRLATYYELLERWNRKINLTALENPDEAIDRLLLEPVLAARHLPESGPNGLKLMDVGSGGGSPALPLTLSSARPIDLTMVEVKTRKSAFLREAIRQLQLPAAQVENARYEELLARPELHERFLVLTIRAVRIEPRTLMTLQAFLQPRGTFLLFRGPSGPEQSPAVMPPLEWVSTVPLVDSLRSRLSILRKVDTSAHVPRLS
jgi:16S rRNA (guanine527-N7)-methyltransferase